MIYFSDTFEHIPPDEAPLDFLEREMRLPYIGEDSEEGEPVWFDDIGEVDGLLPVDDAYLAGMTDEELEALINNEEEDDELED